MSLDLTFFARLFELGSDALGAIDRDQLVVHWNDQLERLSGISRANALGARLSELIPTLHTSDALHLLERGLRGNAVSSSPPFFAVAENQNAYCYEWFATPVLTDGEIRGLVFVARNVIEVPDSVRPGEPPGSRRPASALATERDLERLLYATSHDLREPTRMISNYVELLIGQLGESLDPRLLNYMQFVEEGAERVRTTVDDLLHFAKVRSAEMSAKSVDLARLFGSLSDELSPIVAQKRATLTVGDLPTVCGDAGLLRSLFANLLRNALKFHGDQPPRVQVSAIERATEFVICVSDEGIGFRQEQAERVFELFQRLHPERDYRGSGIGLALAREITVRHDGRIWADAVPDQGARFYVALPRKATVV